MKLDPSLPYGTITGHALARYEQGGMLFDVGGESITPAKLKELTAADDIVETDEVDSARDFLLHILKSGPLSKSAVYKVAETNNQSWDAIKRASTLLGIITYAYRNATMWKLPEDAEV